MGQLKILPGYIFIFVSLNKSIFMFVLEKQKFPDRAVWKRKQLLHHRDKCSGLSFIYSICANRKKKTFALQIAKWPKIIYRFRV